MRILVFDPGESTGWAFYNTITEDLEGGTVRLHNAYDEFEKLFYRYIPQTVVYERFALYPGSAKALSWNTFIPCEMIGVIKFLFHSTYDGMTKEITADVKILDQAAGDRKYISAVEKDKAWNMLQDPRGTKTKHTRDALAHLVYYCRKNKIPAPWK